MSETSVPALARQMAQAVLDGDLTGARMLADWLQEHGDTGRVPLRYHHVEARGGVLVDAAAHFGPTLAIEGLPDSSGSGQLWLDFYPASEPDYATPLDGVAPTVLAQLLIYDTVPDPQSHTHDNDKPIGKVLLCKEGTFLTFARGLSITEDHWNVGLDAHQPLLGLPQAFSTLLYPPDGRRGRTRRRPRIPQT